MEIGAGNEAEIEFLKEIKPVAKGAEAELWLGLLLGTQVVIKKRVKKSYRDPALDAKLRATRTLEEGRLLAKAYLEGVSVPAPLFIDPQGFLLVEEMVSGSLLRDVVNGLPPIMRLVGEEVAKMHLAGLVHGDLTTSNVIITGEAKAFIIDFGLGSFSPELEDRGVDLLLMRKSLEANLPSASGGLFSRFFEGYRGVMGPGADEVLERSAEIERRGRYYAERAID
ncbi:MAG: Kae1-associated kinase Bud32 [Candidatus Marsarchaeota archaeon]